MLILRARCDALAFGFGVNEVTRGCGFGVDDVRRRCGFGGDVERGFGLLPDVNERYGLFTAV